MCRIFFKGLFITIISWLLLVNFAICQDNIIRVGSKKQLFIDDQLIDNAAGVKWQVHPPQKKEPVLLPVPEKEGPRVSPKSILQVGDEYWMYYTIHVPQEWLERDWEGEVPGYVRHMICLAKSRDGIHWKRVDANLFDIGRGKDNAIVMPSSHGTIFLDPNETRGSRFWFIGNITENPWWEESEGAVYKLTDSEGEKVGGAMYLDIPGMVFNGSV